MFRDYHIAFLGTSRSGLGHLRRIANIARHITILDPQAQITLITNAEPAGLEQDDMTAFRRVVLSKTSDMAHTLFRMKVTLAIADTMTLPGMSAFHGKSVLMLRETPQERLSRFRRDDGRAWDLVLVPNTADHWTPALPADFAHRIEHVGWIWRHTGPRVPGEPSTGMILATGGGGNDKTRASLYPQLTDLIDRTRSLSTAGFRLRQALGPRAQGQAVTGVDEVFDPEADLNQIFRAADVVISTAGYNSVLELATTDTPALLVPIPRSLDDQTARVALWGPRLGFGMLPGKIEEAGRWLADQIDAPCRRAPIDLGPDGAARAAEILLDMPCPIS